LLVCQSGIDHLFLVDQHYEHFKKRRPESLIGRQCKSHGIDASADRCVVARISPLDFSEKSTKTMHDGKTVR
jgi:hypothetical protein